MPLKSKAQQRWMHAAEERGELPPGTAKRWEDHTPDIQKLPERVKKAALAKFPDTDLNPAHVGVPFGHEHLGLAFVINKLEEMVDEHRRQEAMASQRKPRKRGGMNKLSHDLYWLGVNTYMTKIANQYPQQMQGYEMGGYGPPPPEKSMYEKFISVKRKHDPYFSTGAGGAIGALLGSKKGKLGTAVGGGLGAMLGTAAAKEKE